MPVQDFGNAFSTFVTEFRGKEGGANQEGIENSKEWLLSLCADFLRCIFFARPLLLIFVQPQESEILAAGVGIYASKGRFYCGIGCLFLLYGFYRAVKLPGNVRGTDGDFSGNPRGPGVSFIFGRASGLGIWWSVPIG